MVVGDLELLIRSLRRGFSVEEVGRIVGLVFESGCSFVGGSPGVGVGEVVVPPGLGSGQGRVYVGLRRWGSQRRVSEELGVSLDTVREHVRVLRERGYVRWDGSRYVFGE